MKNRDKNKMGLKRLFLMISIILSVIMVSVFIIVPAIFILLGSVFPDYISSNNALVQLNSNVNALVGYCSLGVGIFSIIYAYQSGCKMDEQQNRNEKFLQQLSLKIDELQRSNVKLFDQVVNTHQNNTKRDNSQ